MMIYLSIVSSFYYLYYFSIMLPWTVLFMFPVSTCTPFVGYIPRRRIAELWGICIFSFSRYGVVVFQSGAPASHFYQEFQLFNFLLSTFHSSHFWWCICVYLIGSLFFLIIERLNIIHMFLDIWISSHVFTQYFSFFIFVFINVSCFNTYLTIFVPTYLNFAYPVW